MARPYKPRSSDRVSKEAPSFSPEPRARERHDGFTPDRQHAFIEALAECGVVAEAAQRAGVSRSAAYAFRAAAPNRAFRAAWDAALEAAVRLLSEQVFSRALHGVTRPVFYQGDQVGERTYYDERLAMFVLRFRDPTRFGAQAERQEWQAPTPDQAFTDLAVATSDLADVHAREELKLPFARPPERPLGPRRARFSDAAALWTAAAAHAARTDRAATAAGAAATATAGKDQLDAPSCPACPGWGLHRLVVFGSCIPFRVRSLFFRQLPRHFPAENKEEPMRTLPLLAAAATLGAVAAPAAAQYYPQQPTYPQQQYPQQQYPQPGYGYPQQGYPQQQNGINGILGQLLGGRYNGRDQSAIGQCAAAAQAQVARQYSQGYGNRYGQYQPGYGNNVRVVAINQVERRNNGRLRVSGLLDSGTRGYQQQYNGYQQQVAQGDISFTCNVDYNGRVNNVRLRQLTPGRY